MIPPETHGVAEDPHPNAFIFKIGGSGEPEGPRTYDGDIEILRHCSMIERTIGKSACPELTNFKKETLDAPGRKRYYW